MKRMCFIKSEVEGEIYAMKEKISTNKILASTSLVFGILSLFSFALIDGSIVIVAPSKLTTTYKEGLKLSELALPQGWSWENRDTSLSAGTKAYPATFDTTSLESTTDFSNVDGYDPNTHKVTRNVTVEPQPIPMCISLPVNSKCAGILQAVM